MLTRLHLCEERIHKPIGAQVYHQASEVSGQVHDKVACSIIWKIYRHKEVMCNYLRELEKEDT